MPIDVKKVKLDLDREAREVERKNKERSFGSVRMLTLKKGKSVRVQFYYDFDKGMEIPWHDHLTDFKKSGPCRHFFGYTCHGCDHPEQYRSAEKQKPQYFFGVYCFPDQNPDPDDKYPNVGSRVMNVKRASNHPWDMLYDGFMSEGVDLTEGKYLYKRNTAEGADTKYDLRLKGSAVDLPEDVQPPTDEQIKMAVASFYDSELARMIREEQEAEEDEDEDEDEDEVVATPPKKKAAPKVDPEVERKEVFSKLKEAKTVKVGKSAPKQEEDDEEEVVEEKPRKLVTKKAPVVEQEDDDEEIEVKPVATPVSKMKVQKLQTAKAPKQEDDEDDDDVETFRLGTA